MTTAVRAVKTGEVVPPLDLAVGDQAVLHPLARAAVCPLALAAAHPLAKVVGGLAALAALVVLAVAE